MKKIVLSLVVAFSVFSFIPVKAKEWKSANFSGLNIAQNTIEKSIESSNDVISNIINK